MLFLYAYKGTPEHTINICQSLGNYAPIKCDWWGPIAALRLDLLKNIGKLKMVEIIIYFFQKEKKKSLKTFLRK